MCYLGQQRHESEFIREESEESALLTSMAHRSTSSFRNMFFCDNFCLEQSSFCGSLLRGMGGVQRIRPYPSPRESEEEEEEEDEPR